MPEFTVTRHVDAPVDAVWDVLSKFGDIHQWSSGVKSSGLTSDGPVAEGTTRRCDFSPMGAVNERIDRFVPNERMTVNLYETFKLPISEAIADFSLEPSNDGTELKIHYSYTPNRLGRIAKGSTHKQMRKGMIGLADDLAAASTSATAN